jgi:hypothetical protein
MFRMIRMKILTPVWSLLLAGGIFFSSCAQDAIFYTIQYDKALNKNPAIPGGPTRIVEHGDALYVGSNAVYAYTKGGSNWTLFSVPPGKRVLNLARTDEYLYALTMNGSALSDARIYRMRMNSAPSLQWDAVSKPGGYSKIQSIHGAGDTLFAGAYEGSALLYIKDDAPTPALTVIPGVSGMLQAAARSGTNYYYVSIAGSGLLKSTDTTNPAILPVMPNFSGNFLGLISFKFKGTDYLAAVSGGGLVRITDGDGNIKAEKNYDTRLNGTLAVWKNPDQTIDSGSETDLLLLGRGVPGGSSTTSYEYGYRELVIEDDGSGGVTLGSLQTPGSQTAAYTSASRYDTYYNTLGTHAVTSIYQAPWDKALFASTQQNGLWSCRLSGNKEWDVE